MGKISFWRSPSKIFLAINLSFIAIVFVWGLFPSAFDSKSGDGLATYNGRKVSFTGRICEEADADYKSRRLTVCADSRVLVTTDLYPAYDYGDFVEITGGLQSPPAIDGFDYESYLARYDIYSVMYFPKMKMIGGELSWPQKAYRKLIEGKQYVKRIIDSNLPEPEAGLADALLLGYRRTVMREDLDVFARVGLSHMIAISGSHITILSAMALNFLLALGFRRRRSMKIVFVFLFLYPLATGLSASAVRSAIMGGLSFLAMYHGRANSLSKALAFAAAVMLAFNPRLLRDDIGFQLSFLALLGIIYIYPLGEAVTRKFLEKRSWSHDSKKKAKEVIDTINLTMVSQLVSLPIALIDFKQFSVIAPLANVLILWTFAPLLAALVIGIMAAALIPPLGVIFLALAYFLLRFIFAVSGLLARPDWAAVSVSGFGWGFGTVYYVSLFLIIIAIQAVRRRRA